jgi:hypothetical protein
MKQASPGVRVSGIAHDVPIIHFYNHRGLFDVRGEPNFTIGDATSPAPIPTAVFLLMLKPGLPLNDPASYCLVGEYSHSADIQYYAPLPAGEDVIVSVAPVPNVTEYYVSKSITTDKKLVRDIQYTRIHGVSATLLSTGEVLRTYTLPARLVREHVGLRLKPNFVAIAAAELFDASGGGGGGGPPAPTVMDASGDTISHVAPPPLTTTSGKSKVIKGIKTKLVGGSLCPFVARQLLELAQMRKELCPIVAEEFSTGNTAVMPCGHLFAQMAIEESFKKEPDRCPACRQTGRPTYV